MSNRQVPRGLPAIFGLAVLFLAWLVGCVPNPASQIPTKVSETTPSAVMTARPSQTGTQGTRMVVFTLTPKAAATLSDTLALDAPTQDSPVPTLTALTSSTSTPPAAPACLTLNGQEDRGEIITGEITTQYSRYPFQFRVYFPPCYSQDETRRYPVLYMLHGQTYSDDQWDRLGLDDAAGAMIVAREIKPLIIVMPYDRDWEQPAVSPFGRILIEELLPWIDGHYRTLPGRENRAIGGLSRGGSWAVHLGLTHPDLFGSIGAHSTPLFVIDGDLVGSWLDAIPSQFVPRIYVDAGRGDSELASIAAFESVLNTRQIPHEWHLFPGLHTEAYWQAHIRDYLFWYNQGWG